MNRDSIVSEMRALVGANEGQHIRAWALSWRTVRFLERAAETARLCRLAELDPQPVAPVADPVRFCAARCAHAAIRKPVMGEAAVHAALMDAVDVARGVAAVLYADYVNRAEKAAESVLKDPRRLDALRRSRSLAVIRADAFLQRTGGAE